MTHPGPGVPAVPVATGVSLFNHRGPSRCSSRPDGRPTCSVCAVLPASPQAAPGPSSAAPSPQQPLLLTLRRPMRRAAPARPPPQPLARPELPRCRRRGHRKRLSRSRFIAGDGLSSAPALRPGPVWLSPDQPPHPAPSARPPRSGLPGPARSYLAPLRLQ